MKDIITRKFLLENPHKITQYVRGELFIMIDNILGTEQLPSTSEQLSACVEFLEDFIMFFIEYIKILPKYFAEVGLKYKETSTILIFLKYSVYRRHSVQQTKKHLFIFGKPKNSSSLLLSGDVRIYD